jgi:hypothetical protein
MSQQYAQNQFIPQYQQNYNGEPQFQQQQFGPAIYQNQPNPNQFPANQMPIIQNQNQPMPIQQNQPMPIPLLPQQNSGMAVQHNSATIPIRRTVHFKQQPNGINQPKAPNRAAYSKSFVPPSKQQDSNREIKRKAKFADRSLGTHELGRIADTLGEIVRFQGNISDESTAISAHLSSITTIMKQQQHSLAVLLAKHSVEQQLAKAVVTAELGGQQASTSTENTGDIQMVDDKQ